MASDVSLTALLQHVVTDDRSAAEKATRRVCGECQRAPERDRISKLSLVALLAEVAGLRTRFTKFLINIPKDVAAMTEPALRAARLDLLAKDDTPKDAPDVKSRQLITTVLCKPLLTIIFSIARFTTAVIGGAVEEKKSTVAVSFPELLYLRESTGGQMLKYELVSVLMHAGPSVYYGHWTTYRRGADKNWRFFDDMYVTMATLADVLAQTENVVALRYQRAV